MGLLVTLMFLLPLGGSILNGLVLRSPHVKRSGVIATMAAVGSFIISVILFFKFNANNQPIGISLPWISSIGLSWGFTFDPLTALMALVVTGIGSLIHLYSIGYLSHDKTPSRYFAYLNLFLAAMLILITGDNLIVTFVGWEGVGLCSYLLIGYWFEDIEKANAGMKAFILNRIGDAGFLLGAFLTYQLFGSLNYTDISKLLATSSQFDPYLLNVIGLCFFIGAIGKSAQIPLFVWLPDAMAGPTPVSALIHAATMVTAGIYLVCRLSFLYQLTPDANLVIAVIGASTALLAALIATSQRDIKKVLAYSTVSQLGLMFVALGCKAYFAGIFHVFTHAFFKALLFLGAGSVIHALSGEQDIFNMGGLAKKLPFTFWTFLVGFLAINGIPPFAGFFSKDTILFDLMMADRFGLFFWAIASIVSALTAFYMTRLFVLTFLGKARYPEIIHPHESPWVMWLPLCVLALGSLTVGFLGMPHGLHLFPNYLQHFLSNTLVATTENPTRISEISAMLIATASALLSMTFAFWLYATPSRYERWAERIRPLQVIFQSKFWVDELYALTIVNPFQRLGHFFATFIDRTVIDGTFMLTATSSRIGASLLSRFQTGNAQYYLLIMLIGTFLVVVLSMGKVAIW